jgi:hypothetical protein
VESLSDSGFSDGLVEGRSEFLGEYEGGESVMAVMSIGMNNFGRGFDGIERIGTDTAFGVTQGTA